MKLDDVDFSTVETVCSRIHEEQRDDLWRAIIIAGQFLPSTQRRAFEVIAHAIRPKGPVPPGASSTD